MDDSELYDLFSSFDEVSTPQSVKAAAFDGIMAVAAQEGATVAASAEAKPGNARFTAKRGKAKWRAIRVAAVAACLTLALTGGAAYAYYTPVSFVTITQGDTTVELPVNLFGQTLAGTGNEAGIALLGGLDYRGMSLEDSIKVVSESLVRANPDEPISATRTTRDIIEALDIDGLPLAGEQGSADVPVTDDSHADAQEEQHAGEAEAVGNAVAEPSAPQRVVLPAPAGIAGGGQTATEPVATAVKAPEEPSVPASDPESRRSSGGKSGSNGDATPVIAEPTEPIDVDGGNEPAADEGDGTGGEAVSDDSPSSVEETPQPVVEDDGGVRPPKRSSTTD